MEESLQKLIKKFYSKKAELQEIARQINTIQNEEKIKLYKSKYEGKFFRVKAKDSYIKEKIIELIHVLSVDSYPNCTVIYIRYYKEEDTTCELSIKFYKIDEDLFSYKEMTKNMFDKHFDEIIKKIKFLK